MKEACKTWTVYTNWLIAMYNTIKGEIKRCVVISPLLILINGDTND